VLVPKKSRCPDALNTAAELDLTSELSVLVLPQLGYWCCLHYFAKDFEEHLIQLLFQNKDELKFESVGPHFDLTCCYLVKMMIFAFVVTMDELYFLSLYLLHHHHFLEIYEKAGDSDLKW
jgi:hypothetical protein